MYYKTMNTMFWFLILSAIFYTFAATTFVAPILNGTAGELDGEDVLLAPYSASYFAIRNLTIGMDNWSQTLSWIILIILGTLFSVLGFFSFLRYIVWSKKGIAIKRYNFWGAKRRFKLGSEFIDYDFWTNNSSNTFDVRAYSIRSLTGTEIAFGIVLLLNIILGLVIPFATDSQRYEATNWDIFFANAQDQGEANNLLSSEIDNSSVLWACLSNALLSYILGFVIIVLCLVRYLKTKNTKQNNVENNMKGEGA